MLPFDQEKFSEFGKRYGQYRKAAIISAVVLVLCMVFGFILAVLLYLPAGGSARDRLFSVPSGMTTAALSEHLKDSGLIRSATLFEKLVILFGKERGIIAGDYYFPEPLSLYEIARRITGGMHGLVPQKVTIPEGYNVYEIADLFSEKFERFNKEEFISLAKEREGYLFPDTYFFMPNIRAEHVIALMSDNFDDKIADYEKEIDESGLTKHEILTLASIIEEEAITSEDRKLVSGILMRRLEVDMPLQVDATFKYINGKSTYELTLDDLEIDSPYNTYKYMGLPPGPITNPGLDSIEAALRPTETKYLYYLSDRAGKIYYALNFEEHKRNRELYLDK